MAFFSQFIHPMQLPDWAKKGTIRLVGSWRLISLPRSHFLRVTSKKRLRGRLALNGRGVSLNFWLTAMPSWSNRKGGQERKSSSLVTQHSFSLRGTLRDETKTVACKTKRAELVATVLRWVGCAHAQLTGHNAVLCSVKISMRWFVFQWASHQLTN